MDGIGLNPLNRYFPLNMKAAWVFLILAFFIVVAGCNTRQAVKPIVLSIPVTGNTEPSQLAIQPSLVNTPKNFSSQTVPPAPSKTPTLQIIEKGFSAWCFPKTIKPPQGPYTSAIPKGALNSTLEKDLTKILVPASLCAFSYRFNQPFPENMYVLVFGQGSPVPWLKGELIPASDDPKTGIVVFRHEQITNPNAWEVIYFFTLNTSLGKEISKNKVNVYKTHPVRCKNGLLPDPATLECLIEEIK